MIPGSDKQYTKDTRADALHTSKLLSTRNRREHITAKHFADALGPELYHWVAGRDGGGKRSLWWRYNTPVETMPITSREERHDLKEKLNDGRVEWLYDDKGGKKTEARMGRDELLYQQSKWEKWQVKTLYRDRIRRDDTRWMSKRMGEVDGVRQKKVLSGGQKNSCNVESRLYQWVDRDWRHDRQAEDELDDIAMRKSEEDDLQYALYLSLLESSPDASGQDEVDILDLLKPGRRDRQRMKGMNLDDRSGIRPCSPGWSHLSEEEWEEVMLALDGEEWDEWDEWDEAPVRAASGEIYKLR
jgi:hypothetical protein